jgi:hypothetical protein
MQHASLVRLNRYFVDLNQWFARGAHSKKSYI